MTNTDRIIHIEKIEQPRKTFSAPESANAIDELTRAARDGFGTQMEREDIKSHLVTADILYVFKEDERLVGFSAFKELEVHGTAVLYLHGIVVEKNSQKRGLFSEVNRDALSKGYDFLTMRTQNPVIYAAMKKLVSAVYPCEERTPADITDIAETVAHELGFKVKFDKKTFVGRGAYGRSLYDFVPNHPCANDFFKDTLKLRYTEGDYVFLIGRPL